MRIAVVDDEKIFCMQLQMMINKLADMKELSLQVDCFDNGESFIEALPNIRYDVVFMDIYMPGMDGIATAKALRSMTEGTFLIFTTSSEEHYPDAFSLHAFDYLTKPFTMERINTVLDEIIEHTPMDEAFIKVNYASQERKVHLRNIVAVTTDGHYLEIHTSDDDAIRTRMTASEFMAGSGDDARFLNINRGVIVNMDYIDSVEGSEVTMENGMMYALSSKKVSALTQQITDYIHR